ncbi:hypothetical protein [Roseovarius salis]|uniref:hypothetical protein n=1 Tax=Roseovarius salis TaxID=3376063 RepID=UPI0037C957CA
MDPDLLFTSGIVLAVLAMPAALSALAEGRRPRGGIIMGAAAGCLVAWASMERPEGYSLREIPEAFVRVVARYLI